MLLVYIGLYTFVLAVAWGLFVVAKMHSYKFKNFSTNIEKVTNILLVFFIILSITGYVLILFLGGDVNSTTSVDTSGNYDEVYY